jgi:hypothetical protein
VGERAQVDAGVGVMATMGYGGDAPNALVHMSVGAARALVLALEEAIVEAELDAGEWAVRDQEV